MDKPIDNWYGDMLGLLRVLLDKNTSILSVDVDYGIKDLDGHDTYTISTFSPKSKPECQPSASDVTVRELTEFRSLQRRIDELEIELADAKYDLLQAERERDRAIDRLDNICDIAHS